jgi:hypothetical protein
VGSPRHELQTTSNAASAPCVAVCFNSAIVAASTVRSPVANALAHTSARVIHIVDSSVRRAAYALHRATAGRHGHDEHGAPSVLTSNPMAEVGAAVKNLRIADSAVLLLNLREVRRFHFCSVSVAV